MKLVNFLSWTIDVTVCKICMVADINVQFVCKSVAEAVGSLMWRWIEQWLHHFLSLLLEISINFSTTNIPSWGAAAAAAVAVAAAAEGVNFLSEADILQICTCWLFVLLKIFVLLKLAIWIYPSLATCHLPFNDSDNFTWHSFNMHQHHPKSLEFQLSSIMLCW